MRNLLKASAATVVVASMAITSCGESEAALPAPEVSELSVFRFDHTKPAPKTTPEMVVLGRELYHDKRLSTQKNLACASCHDLARFGQDGEPTSPGSGGERGARNSPTSVNAFRQIGQFWDGRAADVEEQAQGPVVNPIEHGFATEADFVAALESIDGMRERFAAVFPGEENPVTLRNFGRAVGAFERTLVTSGRWEKYLAGDETALTPEEKAGLKTFIDVGCNTCHTGKTVGGGVYQKLGLLEPYPTEDLGRYEVTKSDGDKFVFKVPMLLNVAETAPYFHDGSVKTLEEAVRLMGKHQRAVTLTDQQVKWIVAFLKALTGKPQWAAM